MTRFLLTLLILWTLTYAWASGTRAAQPEIRVVYSADWCAPCHKLKARLLDEGAKLKFVGIRQYPRTVKGLPTVEYKDVNGCTLRDNGKRVYDGEFILPVDKVVEVREVPE